MKATWRELIKDTLDFNGEDWDDVVGDLGISEEALDVRFDTATAEGEGWFFKFKTSTREYFAMHVMGEARCMSLRLPNYFYFEMGKRLSVG